MAASVFFLKRKHCAEAASRPGSYLTQRGRMWSVLGGFVDGLTGTGIGLCGMVVIVPVNVVVGDVWCIAETPLLWGGIRGVWVLQRLCAFCLKLSFVKF